ncbi:FmdB family zinc ribbon protein [Bordetella holmesii]|uniref:Zinc ribbon domain protein n=1 Tax=Bordetella holmesii CDC-H585-BH TaxID=1331206 RepID=A0A158M0U0_9BORD|nr:FmdB family zinc ribbon protein [Bordetella holmesii]AHV91890.1 regulatory, FmdB family domain protein [Bordetella holmesii ATCC 51541]EWM41682.1 regulatory, FmdB family domain protein [Bordetella holmesii 41130]AMD45069.1 FmdB family transcriptional regulator [Bordetella holmesii H558]AMD49481.1 FmdB family transcriptional regulator [Bordetella holmesii F627]AOB37162.1 FmdB family transcriptional regulator [Bordetella holmesii]
MPIYAYKCSSCGFAKDVLQKISDAPLTDCPECGKSSFTKQVTAAGFQLKGSGWYVTDFRNNSSGNAPAAKAAPAESGAAAADTSSASAPASTPAAAPTTPGATT